MQKTTLKIIEGGKGKNKRTNKFIISRLNMEFWIKMMKRSLKLELRPAEITYKESEGNYYLKNI